MSLHVVVGAGPTGSAVARLLADSGQRVRVVSRRGNGPDHPLVERVAIDAAAGRLVETLEGATTLFNCAMPPYDRWPAEWPPLAAALLNAAERTGADYIMLGNTYGYGLVDGPVTETLPMAATTVKGRVRAQMWTDALAAHEAGRVRVTEVRASDYLGAGAASLFTLLVVPEVLAGRPVSYLGDLDAAHSWSHTWDVARTLVAVSRHDAAFGRAWHVPSTSDLPVRQLTARLAEVAGAPAPTLSAMPDQELERLGETDSIMAEIPEMRYLYQRPHVLDSTRTEQEFGLKPTPLDDVLAETISLGTAR
ncbi:NAD-dependent epimerase/dehydratase family protein [Nonomuraea muscovyensis]|uniref:Nucleoside-diphosphate-sugar epimerase n=1 Tax=Nonomuraea muscovyensis TaxID=1124761 RepID=A0A7X0CBW4_9ACTN|nr:NAD-dependent epimerase/dehydratase family protein [Nonomuraea muscovyensis]MBB6350474.1 nucleoside-diphosphate-sugar epimerase [Nonomuraea muscovyensis]